MYECEKPPGFVRAVDLQAGLVRKGHSPAAAHWAILDSIEDGSLIATVTPGAVGPPYNFADVWVRQKDSD